MNQLSEKFATARRASGMTLEQVTKAASLKAVSTYVSHEEAPLKFRLVELKGMYDSMNSDARRILKEAIDEIFLP